MARIPGLGLGSILGARDLGLIEGNRIFVSKGAFASVESFTSERVSHQKASLGILLGRAFQRPFLMPVKCQLRRA